MQGVYSLLHCYCSKIFCTFHLGQINVEFLQVLLAFTEVSLDLHFSYHGKTVQKVGFGFYTSLQLVSLFSKKQSFVVFYVDQLGAINK